VTNSYIAGLGLDLPLLESLRLPKKVEHAMSSYIANQKYLERYMTHWLQEPPAQRRADLADVANQLLASDRSADGVRSLLGLPPVYG
jgi:hypothetical protein